MANFTRKTIIYQISVYQYYIYKLKGGFFRFFILIIFLGAKYPAISQILFFSDISSSGVQTHWSSVPGATSYKLRYRESGSVFWNYFTSPALDKELIGLKAYCLYEAQVSARNSSGVYSYSSIQTFRTRIPVPEHVLMLILENHPFGSVIGSPAAPFINSLLKSDMTALFTSSYGLQHPSQPNYLHLFSGSNQGVDSNYKPDNLPFSTTNLFGSLYKAGIKFKCYSEDLPVHGYNGEFNGAYARKHNPVANWMGTGPNQVPPELNAPFSQFPKDLDLLPSFCYVIPNQDNDMHNGYYPANIMAGDAWVSDHIGPFINWAEKHNSLLILTFDEDDGMDFNHIPTLFYGPMVQGGIYPDSICHYHVLRTLEEMYDLPFAGASASANAINCWKNLEQPGCTLADPTETSAVSGFEYFPNPVQKGFMIRFTVNKRTTYSIQLLDLKGRDAITDEVSIHLEKGLYERFISTQSIPQGIYMLRLTAGNDRYDRKLVIFH